MVKLNEQKNSKKTDKKGEPVGSLEELCAEHYRLSGEIKRLELRKQAIRDHLEKNLPIGTSPFGDYKVVVYKSERVLMDKEKLKVLLGAKFDLYCKKSASIGVRVALASEPDEPAQE